MLSQESLARIDREVAKYPPDQKQSAVMGALRIAQEEKGLACQRDDRLRRRYLDMPPIAAFEVAASTTCTTSSRSENTRSRCAPTCRALSGGVHAADYIKHKLGIGFNETTADGRSPSRRASAWAPACDAPVLLVNNHRMCSWMTPERSIKCWRSSTNEHHELILSLASMATVPGGSRTTSARAATQP